MNNPSLTIAHNLFLTKEQRYELFEGKDLNITGVSVPVWHEGNSSSEPANEVFCKYKLKRTDAEMFVRYKDSGFLIHLSNQGNLAVKCLLDLKDGGIEYLGFKYPGRLKNKNKYIKVVHLVEIKDMTELIGTL